MHRTIGYLSKRLMQVRPGEGPKVLLTFLYFFLIITAYYVIKPVSRALVLGDMGSRMVPYVDLISALVMGPVVTLFARLVDRMTKRRLVTYSFWGVTALLLGFWGLMHLPNAAWVAGAFYVWVSVFSVLVVMLFWLVANDLYRPRDAKRLFGFIGSGGILGGIVGSSVAAAGAQIVGTTHLLLISAILLIACWGVVERLWRYMPEREPAAEPSSHKGESFLKHPMEFARLILQSRYLLLLVFVVGVTKVVSTLVYYQFNPFIEQMFPAMDAKTTFTGIFFAGMNVAAFVIQFFFTSWVLRRWGLPLALSALPVGLLAASFGLIIWPLFWVAVGAELFDGAMNYSLQQTTKEVLYLPIDRSIRYKVKPFIDMVVFRFGKGLAAILGIVLLDVYHVKAVVFSYLIIPLCAAWLVAALWLRRDYVQTIRIMLQARAAKQRAGSHDREAGGPAWATGGDEEALLGVSPHGPLSARKLTLLSRLMTEPDVQAPQLDELLAHLADYEVQLANHAELDADRHQLKIVIMNPEETMGRRRQAVRWLARFADQDTVDYLFGLVLLEADAVLRQEAVKSLVRLRLRGCPLEVPASALRRQIAAEVVNYQRVIEIASVCRRHSRGTRQQNETITELLRTLMEESVEQIFRLLMLLHRPEDIQLVFEQLRGADAHLRADALELLDNLVDASTRHILLPILDEDRFLAILEETPLMPQEPTVAYRVLQEAIWDHNCWLSVATLCAVGRLQLTPLRQEVEKASRHQSRSVSLAAKLALRLTEPASSP